MSKIISNDSLCHINSFIDIYSLKYTRAHTHIVEIIFGMIHSGTHWHNHPEYQCGLGLQSLLPFHLGKQSIREKPTPAHPLSSEVGKAPRWSPECLLVWQEARRRLCGQFWWPGPTLLLQESQLLQSFPSVLIRDAFWGNLDTDTGGSRQFVTALSLVRQALEALFLIC